MDFNPNESQVIAGELAGKIFAENCQHQRLKVVEASEERIDRDLWKLVADAGLLGLWISEDIGGSGLGVLELCSVLEQQGEHVAPVPLWSTAVAAMTIDRFGTDEMRSEILPGVIAGERIISPALSEASSSPATLPWCRAEVQEGSFLVSGRKVSVPAGAAASHLLVPARMPDGQTSLFLVETDSPSVRTEPTITTNRERHAHVTLAQAPARRLGEEAAAWAYQHSLVALCAIQAGVMHSAVRRTAEYTSTRRQFGKTLSYFQGVLLRAADCYVDLEAARSTMWFAAWELSEGLDAGSSSAVAKWWASEAGHRVAHASLHLHGGLGNDLDYPLHRYFLWAKQIDASLGSASLQLAVLGDHLVRAQA